MNAFLLDQIAEVTLMDPRRVALMDTTAPAKVRHPDILADVLPASTRAAGILEALAVAPPRPVVSITRKFPGRPRQKFARVTFPSDVGPLEVVSLMARFPPDEGYRLDLRQVGPHGFSEPLDLDAYFAAHEGLASYCREFFDLP